MADIKALREILEKNRTQKEEWNFDKKDAEQITNFLESEIDKELYNMAIDGKVRGAVKMTFNNKNIYIPNMQNYTNIDLNSKYFYKYYLTVEEYRVMKNGYRKAFKKIFNEVKKLYEQEDDKIYLDGSFRKGKRGLYFRIAVTF